MGCGGCTSVQYCIVVDNDLRLNPSAPFEG